VRPEELIALREQLGMSQRQLALRLGIDAHTLRRWEEGAHRVDPITEELLRILAEQAAARSSG
jgi:DNA-binding transcriptional regulator YiaG